jgi:hypothetical protein
MSRDRASGFHPEGIRAVYTQAHISNTPKSVCTRKELSSVFNFRPSGQSSNHRRASCVKSIKATCVSDYHQGPALIKGDYVNDEP